MLITYSIHVSRYSFFRYMFLEYQNPREAMEAVKSTDGYRLDKQHTFQVNLFTDFDKYSSIPDEWEQPAPQPYKDPVMA